jgi:hypothetical protein
MAWTTALTNFSDGNTPTAAQLNEYVANLDWLHDLPTNSYEQPQGANLTTTSLTWANISANYSLSLTTTGGPVFIYFAATLQQLEIDIAVNGTRRGTAGVSGEGIVRYQNGIIPKPITIPFVISLAAGAHTIAAQWRVPSAVTGTILVDHAPRFFVRQI